MFAKVIHSHNYHMGKQAKCSPPKIFFMPFLAYVKYALFCKGLVVIIDIVSMIDF